MTVPVYGTINDHGTWARYTPSPVPADAPPNALFSRRDSDSIDWYDYVNPGSNFGDATVIKMTVGSDNIVRAAVLDPTRLFPGNGVRVLEVTGASTADPQADWGGFVYDPNTQTFSDPPPPVLPPGPGPGMTELLARVEALEAQLKANK
jgi:hypothetical protein